jgi:cyclopropane-fatty-acyl-phospholipid synthase
MDQERKMEIANELKTMPIAVETQCANQQHYEVPARFYDLCLGPNKKYSSGFWPFPASKLGKGKKLSWDEGLEMSEVAMLDLYMQRAGIKDGMKVVDLGCGWGSVTLHIAKHFPNCKITSISNSHSQREYILNTAKERGYNVDNIRVITCDASLWQDKQYFAEKLQGVENNDVVISIEMFEHMKNYSVLFEKVSSFLGPDGKLFVHVFTHKDHAYHFSKGTCAKLLFWFIIFPQLFRSLSTTFVSGWMADTFFTGGTMPSDDLFLYFAEHFSIANHWRVNGSNYEKTSNAWLKLMDRNWKSGELKPVLEEAYGKDKGYEWYINWRLFYLACAELFGMNGGEEWIVSHYLFDKR